MDPGYYILPYLPNHVSRCKALYMLRLDSLTFAVPRCRCVAGDGVDVHPVPGADVLGRTVYEEKLGLRGYVLRTPSGDLHHRWAKGFLRFGAAREDVRGTEGSQTPAHHHQRGVGNGEAPVRRAMRSCVCTDEIASWRNDGS